MTPPDRWRVGDGGTAEGGVDALRVRSFLGLSLGLVGPRANLAVSGVLLTLLVSSRVSSAVAITFALTANRLVGWIAYPGPRPGQRPDQERRRAPGAVHGRRAVPHGRVHLGVHAGVGFLAPGALIVVVKTASVVFGLTNVAVIPETFGKSRTIKASIVIGILGALVSLIIKGTVIATWKANDPSSWNLPFREAGALMMIVAVVVLVLVREAPAARDAADAERRTPARPWRLELAEIMSGPNARVLVGGILVFWSGLSATGYLAIVYFEKVQHAGANVQTIAAYISGVPVVMFGLGLGYVLSRHLTRKQVAVLTPVAGRWCPSSSSRRPISGRRWSSPSSAHRCSPPSPSRWPPCSCSCCPVRGDGRAIGEIGGPLQPLRRGLLVPRRLGGRRDRRLPVIWLFPAAAGVVQAIVMCWFGSPRA